MINNIKGLKGELNHYMMWATVRIDNNPTTKISMLDVCRQYTSNFKGSHYFISREEAVSLFDGFDNYDGAYDASLWGFETEGNEALIKRVEESRVIQEIIE